MLLVDTSLYTKYNHASIEEIGIQVNISDLGRTGTTFIVIIIV